MTAPAEREIQLLDGKPIDVLVYQMGKVGSVAVTTSLERVGLNAIQTHFLGEAKLGQMLDRLVNPATNSFVLAHGIRQLVLNIQLTHWINEQRAGALADLDGAPEKLRVISIARDPKDWYRSNLVQNFEGLIDDISRFDRANGGDPNASHEALLATHLTRVEHVIGCTQMPVGTPGNQQEIEALTRGFVEPHLLRRHVQEYLRPTVWFDAFFLPILSLDVYAVPFEGERGAERVSNRFADALVLKFESPERWAPNIGELIGVPGFEIERENVSSEKSAYETVSGVWRELPPNPACDRRIYDTRYASHFGYRSELAPPSE